MVDPLVLAAFVPAALALNMTPGADMMFCVGQGLRHGPVAAWVASAGIAVGGMVHVLIAGAGLGALLNEMPLAFDIIRWLGVAYLMWLAIQAVRVSAQLREAPPAAPRRAFRSGLIVNLTNPKVILFVLAFIPQFIDPQAGPVVLQFLTFGAVIGAGGFVINGVAGVFAGTLGQKLARGGRVLNYLTAGIYSALAVRLAIMERV